MRGYAAERFIDCGEETWVVVRVRTGEVVRAFDGPNARALAERWVAPAENIRVGSNFYRVNDNGHLETAPVAADGGPGGWTLSDPELGMEVIASTDLARIKGVLSGLRGVTA